MKVLYHANCTDGAGAALAAWLYLGDKTSTGEEIDYIPVQYGSEPPDVDNEEVFALDFSYSRETLISMAKAANRITVIDHHKTAQQTLSDPFPKEHDGSHLCDVVTIFDMSKSGAVLAWEYFNPDEDLPDLFRYIQDRDLWQWVYPESKDILLGLQLAPDWKTWPLKKDQLAHLQHDGVAIRNYLEIQSKKIVETPPQDWEYFAPAKVPVYNLPGFMISDTLHLALERWPDAPFAVGYFYLPNKRVYSLRSRNGSNVDVSKIAKFHGGGGHKHAAGFTQNDIDGSLAWK